MPDLQHTFGADLTVSPSGDLAMSTGAQLGLERVLRRLMTVAGAYIWQPGYGAGLPAAVGQVANVARLTAVIRTQMLAEATVARTPPPTIDVTSSGDGTVFAYIKYADAATGATQTLSLPVK